MRVLVFSILSGLTACASSQSFVQTGDLRAPRSDDTWVQPYLAGPPSETYQEIGVVEVRGRNLKKRVERASEIARDKGGNGVVLLNSRVHVKSYSFGSAGFQPFFGFAGPAYGFGTGFSSNTRSYEVDRYVVIHIDGTVKRPTSKQLSLLDEQLKDAENSIRPGPDEN